MQSHFKLDPPSQSRSPRYVARGGGMRLAAGDDLREVALRGQRLAYPQSHVVVYEGFRVAAVICPDDHILLCYSPEDLLQDLSTATVVEGQVAG